MVNMKKTLYWFILLLIPILFLFAIEFIFRKYIQFEEQNNFLKNKQQQVKRFENRNYEIEYDDKGYRVIDSFKKKIILEKNFIR